MSGVSTGRRRWWLPLAAALAGAALGAGIVVSSGPGDAGAPDAGAASTAGAAIASRASAPLRAVNVLQERLRRVPDDASGWAELGSSYVELARATANPAYYPLAQGALDRSLRIRPESNGPAMIGMGALANARHDFAVARDWALRAQAVQPDTAEVYGVLADALTQLGDDAGAAAAVQRMLDLRPGVAAFARASYHFELHGQGAEAVAAMEQALASATTPDEIAFCRYHLGELAFDAGRVDDADAHYEQGLAVSGRDAQLLRGRARVAAARGELEQAIAGYRQVVELAPQPQHLAEYAEVLTAAGRGAEAAQQHTVLAEQHRLMRAQGATDDLTAAMIAADHGDKAEALRLATAEWSRRQSVFTAAVMAQALHVNGRDAEALPYAIRAAALGWRNATLAYHHGMILAALGRTAEAEERLTTALRINPHFSIPHAPRAELALAELRSRR